MVRLFEDEQPDRAREIAGSVPIDLGDQAIDRNAARRGYEPQPIPECPLQGYARRVAGDPDRPFLNAARIIRHFRQIEDLWAPPTGRKETRPTMVGARLAVNGRSR